MIFSKFYPNEYQQSVYTMDFQKLYNAGYRGIMFDIDNTLVKHDAPANEELVNFIQSLDKIGFKICLLSNNDSSRVACFCKDLCVLRIHKAGKPAVRGYNLALKLLGTDKEHTLMVGDQIFTDIFGANRAGLYSILVKPIDKAEDFKIKLKRILEKPIINSYQKKMCKQYISNI